MRRLLEPCGTPAAYQRHRKAGEPACADCKAAHSAYIVKRRQKPEAVPTGEAAPTSGRPRGSYKGHRDRSSTEMERLLVERPPVIVWAKNRRGVMVAVEVHDPHGETSIQAQAERLRACADRADRKAAAREMEQARLAALELLRQEADHTANTSLMTAARTPL